MSACPRREAFPGPSTEPDLKPRFLQISSESRSRSSPISLATTTIPRLRNRWLSATQLGRALSTAAKCGRVQPPRQQLLPARTRVARIRANGRQNPVQNHLYPTPEDEGRIRSG